MKIVGKCAIITGLILGLSAGTPTLARANSFADTPLPALPGASKPTRHVFSVSSVMDLPNLTTSFHCTSTEKKDDKTIRWGVEVFENGLVKNDLSIGEGYTLLNAGRTRVISIANTATFSESDTFDTPIVIQGSARILADSNKITCAAFLLDPHTDPPTFIVSLPLIKKTNQKGH